MNKEKEILRQQPFRRIIKIIDVKSLKGRGAISGKSFMVISSTRKKYKLRYCGDLRKAKEIERNVKLLPKAFPKFYGREGRYLLFNWIEGEHLTTETPLEICYKIGKLVGEAHALKDMEKKDEDSFFYNRLKIIKKTKIFDTKTLAKIELTYKKFKEKLKLDITLEFNDIHPGNMIMTKKEEVYYIDEEGFGHKIKGLGFAKPFLTDKWMKKKEQKEAFWKGYNEHHSSDYFDKDYEKFILFLQLIRTIATRIRTGNDYSKEKAILLKILKQKVF